MGLVMIWDPVERLFWGIAIAIALLCGLYFIYKGRRRENFNEKIIMFGLASLPLGFGISLTFIFLQVFRVQGIFIDNIFYGDYADPTPTYEFFGRLSYISIGIGAMFFALAFDIIVKHTKYILTIISIIIIIIEIFSPRISVARFVFNFFLIPELIIIVPLILFLYTKRSHLEFKAVSSFLLFGFLLFILSLNLAKRAHKMLNAFPLILSPLFLLIGCCIIILPAIIDPKILSRALVYWVIYAILTIPLLILILYIDIIKGLHIAYIIVFFVGFVYVYALFFLIIKDIRSELILVNLEVDKEKSDFLRMFTRPQNITEEDVIFHRENKICLVCKAKLKRSIYICPECDVLYCKRCSKAMSLLENACWVCNIPFDPSKSVLIYHHKEQDLKSKGPKNSAKKISDGNRDS